MSLVPTSELRMVNFKGKSTGTMKSNQSKPQRKEIWDQRWHVLDVSVLFLWQKAVFPERIKYFLTLLQTTDLDYTEISWVYVLFLFFIFDVYNFIFICDIRLMFWEARFATKGLYIYWPYPEKLAYIPPVSYLRVIEYVW